MRKRLQRFRHWLGHNERSNRKMVIPLVVDKNDDNGNYVSSSEAKLFVNDEPIARTLTCKCGGGQEVHHNNMVCVAMRGRNPEHPTDRTAGIHTEQRLEMNKDGLVNTLTTVQKDNLCLEIKQATKEGSIKCKVGGYYDASYPDSKTRRGRVQDNGDTVPTLTASSSENINYVETVYRIRKLTPKECFRLMSFRDEDYEAASKVNSNSQLYKQAGNSICECVLKAIFSQMGIKGIPRWNDTH